MATSSTPAHPFVRRRRLSSIGALLCLAALPYLASAQMSDYKSRPSESFSAVQRLAQSGNGTAQARLGEMYLNGEDAPQDEALAKKWLLLASNQNVARAYWLLGNASMPQTEEDRKGVVEAAKFFRRGAELGDAACQTRLGSMFELGQGVEKNMNEALRWNLAAAAQGDDQAQYALYTYYETGKGVIRNPREAMKWLTLSAARGNKQSIQAQQRLATALPHAKVMMVGATAKVTPAPGRPPAPAAHAVAELQSKPWATDGAERLGVALRGTRAMWLGVGVLAASLGSLVGSAVLGIRKGRELEVEEPKKRRYRWGYFQAALGASFGTIGTLASLYTLLDGGSMGLNLAMGPLMVYLGMRAWKRSRIGLLGLTILGGPLAWVCNTVYLARRWNELER